MATPYAFVTLVSSDSYLPGALAVVAALKEVHPKPPVPPEVDFQTVCLVTPETVDVSTIKLLRKSFDLVVGVEVIEQQDAKGLQLLGRLDLNTVLTKLHVFRLTQYSKIIFLDADVLPIRPLSHLFTLPHDFAAVPDVGWPDIFNSGVLVLSPGEEKFQQLTELNKTKGSWDGGDQGLLNEWQGSNWHRLSFTYNTTPTAAYTYAPAYERFGSKISAIHFIGPDKPWKALPYRAPGTTSMDRPNLGPQQTYDYSNLLDRWFDVYDRNYRIDTPSARQEFEVRRYASVWDQGNSFGAEMPVVAGETQAGGVLDLEELKRVTTEGISSLSMRTPDKPAEGEYRSLPLEGRVDLMRPKPEPQSQGQWETQATFVSPLDSHLVTTGEPSQIRTLPTPGPHEVPPAPYLRGQSLPPTPSAAPYYVAPVVQAPQPAHAQPHYELVQQGLSLQSGQPVSGVALSYGPQDSLSYQSPPSESSVLSPISSVFPSRSGHSHPHIRYQPPGQVGHAPQQYQQHHEHHLHHVTQHQHRHVPQSPVHQWQGGSHGSPTQPRSAHNSSVHHVRRSTADHTHLAQPQPHQGEPQSPQVRYYPREHPRSPSPPKVSWNPAVEPPPRDLPPVSAFPSDTYFPNVWDQAPSQQHDATYQSFSPPSTPSINRSDVFFHPPPPPVIPEQLVRDGQYANVLGTPVSPEKPSEQTQVPTPDVNKVKSIFPWEEKPRHVPRRVFPSDEAPPPTAKFIEEEKPKPAAEERPHLHIQTRSPPAGLPSNFTYTNAWDTVPSIQRYASKLVRPHPFFLQQPLPQPPDNGWRKLDKERRRDWQERQDASSMDGDVEDEGEDEEESEASDSGSAKRRSRASSTVSISAPSKSGKHYKMRGVQTINPKMKSQGVQVTILRDNGARARTESGSSTKTFRTANSGSFKREWSGTSSPSLLPSAVLRDAKTEYHGEPEQMTGTPSVNPSLRSALPFPSMATPTGLRSPQTLGSPRTYSPPKGDSPAKIPSPSNPLSPHMSPARTVDARRTSVPSPPKAASPLATSPPQAPSPRPAASPRRVSASTPPLKAESPVNGNISARVPQTTPPAQRSLPKLSSPFSPEIQRSISTETAATLSPASTASLVTPENTPLVTTRKIGRVFDPARGVDIFKRSSEEVLARFLRTGSFEEEESQRRQHVQQ